MRVLYGRTSAGPTGFAGGTADSLGRNTFHVLRRSNA
jgi:hypothetical protein